MSWTVTRIVVPVDFSGESEHAIRTALDLVDDPADVHCVHVLLPLDHVSPGVVLGDVTDDSRQEAAKSHLDRCLMESALKGLTTRILMGSPGHEIAEYARTVSADLIVIPSHGYHGVKRLVLGSVAERVIRHAECSVLVTRRADAE